MSGGTEVAEILKFRGDIQVKFEILDRCHFWLLTDFQAPFEENLIYSLKLNPVDSRGGAKKAKFLILLKLFN